MKKRKYRISIDEELYNEMMKVLDEHDFDLAREIRAFTKEPGATYRQKIALVNVAAKKQRKTEQKIEDAVRALVFANEELTIYKVAKTAKISYNTAKKYEDFINEVKSKSLQ